MLFSLLSLRSCRNIKYWMSKQLSKRAAAALNQRSFSLRLYKSVLRSNQLLPPAMRDLGNNYTREEFKRHKTAKPEFLNDFFKQWLTYLSQMAELRKSFADPENSNSEPKLGVALPEEILESFSEEQQSQLDILRKEALKLALVDSEEEKPAS